MRVMKFGAVTAGDAARLEGMVQIVTTACQDDPSLVVVCTTLPEVTDALINAARNAASGSEAQAEATRRDLWNRHRALAERLVRDDWEREALYREWADLLKTFDRITRSIATLGELSPRGVDAVAAVGERFIAHLYAVILRRGGIAARMVDATELIVTDNHFGAAHVLPDESVKRIKQRLASLLQAKIVPVVAGYIGATREGVVTTLGRGGGDYTAALLGAALKADEVCIWTDVDGIMTADPKIVAEARTLPELSYDEAGEIATFGAEVLHPRTLAPVVEQGGVLRLRNALHPRHPGTAIVPRPQPSGLAARAIISARNLRLLTLTAANGGWTADLAVQALAELNDSGVDILTFAQSFSERSLTLAVRATDADFARRCLTDMFERKHAERALRDLAASEPVALIAVISAAHSDLGPRILAALGRAGAHVLALAQATRSSNLSFLLPESEVEPVVRTLHRELGLSTAT